MKTGFGNHLTASPIFLTAVLTAGFVAAEPPFRPPSSPRVDYNFNPGWKFNREDVANADQAAFDDAKWADVSAPYTYNDVDSHTDFISQWR
jgi:hypothetical protein